MRAVFVIPVIHPDHPIVSDYDVIERVLKLTVTSLLQQTEPDVAVAVAAHRRPDWADSFSDRVAVLTLPDHPDSRPLRYTGIPDGDQGVKRALAGLYALHKWAPQYAVPMDGDDFMDVSLVAHLCGGRLGPSGDDGYILTQGYQALLRGAGTGFEINGALRVREFNETCGSCRVFKGAAFERLLAGIDPDLPRIAGALFTRDGPDADLSPCLERIAAAADRRAGDLSNPVRLLGDHVALAGYLDLAPVGLPLAAKGCGHSSHIGPLRGEVHWNRTMGILPISRFRRRFGLTRQENLVSAPNLYVQAREAITGPARRVLRRLGARVQPRRA
ncbi:MAG: hypothetical protein AAGG09_14095 [Pseudomonadota bacterium]